MVTVSSPARPAAWDWYCHRCGERRDVGDHPSPWDLPEHAYPCGSSGAPYRQVLWGDQWAAVATLARHEQAAGELWAYLDRLRCRVEDDPSVTHGDLKIAIDSLPEVVMQVLALGEGF